jgi:hypothetical protein
VAEQHDADQFFVGTNDENRAQLVRNENIALYLYDISPMMRTGIEIAPHSFLIRALAHHHGLK